MKAFRSKFVQTVPDDLYQQTCEEIDQAFADSYLASAKLDGQYLTPRTLIGWTKISGRSDFRALLKRLQITLVKPTPYPGEGDRMSADDLARGIR